MPLLDLSFTPDQILVSLKKWILLALLFSWVGDILLMFESERINFFLFGLLAFLIAHVFYIVFIKIFE